MGIQHLSGVIAAPFTPMDRHGDVDISLIPSYYQFLKHNGISGAFICGSTGEGASLTSKEKMKVNEAWAACTKEDASFKVMTLVGGNCLRECKELAIHARETGLYAVSYTSPSYFKPASVKELADCCLELAEAVQGLPFYYYHIPVLTGVNFSMLSLLQEIEGKIQNFAGIKYTHEDFMDFLSCQYFQQHKYDMLWGRDENMLPALSLGAKAFVGSTFNYAAPLYHKLIKAFENGDLPLASLLQQQSINMISLLGKYGGIATGKAYMKLIGMDCGEFRLPVKNMVGKDWVNFREDVEKIHFGNFCSQQPGKTSTVPA